MKTVFSILVLLVSAAGAYAYLKPVPPGDTPPAPAEATLYKNSTYGYRLTVPPGLDTKEYTPENVVFGHIAGDAVDGVAEARIMTIRGDAGEPFDDVLARNLANLCAADGPSASISCIGIAGTTTVATIAGVRGTEMFLDAELTNLRTGTTTAFRKGPYYAFLRGTSATGSSVLVIHAPLNQSAEEADAATIHAIAQSLVLE